MIRTWDVHNHDKKKPFVIKITFCCESRDYQVPADPFLSPSSPDTFVCKPTPGRLPTPPVHENLYNLENGQMLPTGQSCAPPAVIRLLILLISCILE